MNCHFCHTEIKILDRIGRRDSCDHCGRDLHICKNCEFWDEKVYNECRETQADRVVEKETANFCDYFAPAQANKSGPMNKVDEAKKKLAELFK